MRDFNRNNRDDRRGGGRFNRRDGGGRQMHQAVCTNCGKDCQVPFRPTGDKPVLCSECFGSASGGSNRRPANRFGRPPQRPGQSYEEQFETLNKRLDTILDILLTIKKTLKEEPSSPVQTEKQAEADTGEDSLDASVVSDDLMETTEE